MMSSSGISAFSRLFQSMRRMASCRQPLQEISSPRGALNSRGTSCFGATRARLAPRYITIGRAQAEGAHEEVALEPADAAGPGIIGMRFHRSLLPVLGVSLEIG